ncbi:RNase E specificity factor CsrD [Vibrio sp. SCSIO 43137]|uniref:RNase E specificity factor CsrD n=1 Tax=Vibrio sp. SCSIO 43137 TaxID=3021011 RepID=UPI002307DCA7|nr:RNase E specificity factor CsrD [Vibrio sp. SCSIO 43137]WCE29996.1 RNase E specificity factor CsrD [Vibrio sp. SCSIO 43137]
MRYTPTLKLSARLTAFVTIIVVSAMFILFIGGTLSFRNMGHEYLNRYLEGIVTVVDEELGSANDLSDIQRWIPKLLKASHVVEMEISSPAGNAYHFVDTSRLYDKSRLVQKSYALESSQSYTIHFKALPPYSEQAYSFSALSSISLAIALVVFCLIQGLRWLKVQLKGSELLEERGRMILGGRVAEHSKGNPEEWPYTASQALDRLIEELQDARQERSRFDTFIRTHTFLDQLTGAANRVLFDSKLESALQESGASGGVLLLRINDWEALSEQNPKQNRDEFIVEVGSILSNIVQRFPDVVFARYYTSDFAVLVPHQNSKDIAILATQCIRQLERIALLEGMQEENWCHMGITMYSEGERRGHILSEVDTALRSAQLQNNNNWSRFQKKEQVSNSRGSVRWRTLFDKSFQNDNVLIYEQACYLAEPDSNKTTLLHSELFSRINDDGVGILKASRFVSAIEQIGYEAKMDKVVFATIIRFLKESSLSTCYSINLHVLPFQERSHVRWLRDELLQLPSCTRNRLSFEFVEGALVKHLDFMRPVVRIISGLGCDVIVGQAGRTITSTHYIKDLGVDYLKLHRSLIKKIDQRQENQLFIRSLIGACEGTKTRVLAVGVETGREWTTLLELGVDGGQGRMFQAETQLIPKPEVAKVQIGRRNRWRKKY